MKKLLAILVAVPLSAGGMGSIHAAFGWGKVTQVYDTAGKAQDIVPAPGEGSVQVLNLHVGGSYTVFSLPSQSIFLGAGLHLQQHSESFTVGGQTRDRSSGFAPQAFLVHAGLRGPMYMASLGFAADLGPDTSGGKIENSDRQHDIFVRASAWLPNPMFALSGYLAYHFTLARSEDLGGGVTAKIDRGDWFEIGAKGGYKFPMGEAGLVLNYILKTKASVDGNSVNNSDGYLLTVYPYVEIAPPVSPVSFTLKLAAVDEYAYYGFSLAGKNLPVTRLGFTLGASMSL